MTEANVYYNYNEAVARIEEFMKSSGIRSYCEQRCFGACCRGCYESENSCHKNEGRRISCSVFICSALKKLVLSEKEVRNYYKIQDAVCDAINTARRGAEKYISSYFKPISEEARDRFRIRKSIFDRLLPDQPNLGSISSKMHGLGYLAIDLQGAQERRKCSQSV